MPAGSRRSRTPDPAADVTAAGPPGLHPIRGLLRKEWAVLRPRYRAGLALVFLLGALQTIRSDEAFLWLGILLAGALALTVPVIEWRRDTDRLLASLPVRRSSIVLARYIVAAAGTLVAWGVWVAAGAALGPLLAAGHPEPRIWADLPGALTFFALAGILLAAFLPLYFRIGMGRTAVAFLPIGIALAAAARWIAIAATPPVATPPGAGGRVASVLLAPPGAAVRRALEGLTALGGGVAVAAVAATLLALIALSAWASLEAFRRREL